ncbi:Endoglucanase 19-like, partial [Homarus americanus]
MEDWEHNYNADFSSATTIPFKGLDLTLTFDAPVDSMSFWDGSCEKIDDTHFHISNSKFYETGMYVDFNIQVTYSGATRPDIVAVEMNGQDACALCSYGDGEALCMSFLFYEAQRSGHLPEDQRVEPWRWDSAMDDGADVGHNLTGGYYDAGDHVKFGFPMAFTTTVLAWGLIDFAEGYEAAGQTDYGRAAVKWATDYFLKAHTADYELYGQVGKGTDDHNFWGRPEDMMMARPSMKINKDAPGTELACETAAALAAASIVFKKADPDYSAEMLEVAKELYAFGDEYRLEYHKSITDAADYY